MLPHPLKQAVEDFGKWPPIGQPDRKRGGPDELAIAAYRQTSCSDQTLSDLTLCRLKWLSCYAHKGLHPAVGLISSLRAIYKTLLGDWKGQPVTGKSVVWQESNRPGSLKLTYWITSFSKNATLKWLQLLQNAGRNQSFKSKNMNVFFLMLLNKVLGHFLNLNLVSKTQFTKTQVT